MSNDRQKNVNSGISELSATYDRSMKAEEIISKISGLASDAGQSKHELKSEHNSDIGDMTLSEFDGAQTALDKAAQTVIGKISDNVSKSGLSGGLSGGSQPESGAGYRQLDAVLKAIDGNAGQSKDAAPDAISRISDSVSTDRAMTDGAEASGTGGYSHSDAIMKAVDNSVSQSKDAGGCIRTAIDSSMQSGVSKTTDAVTGGVSAGFIRELSKGGSDKSTISSITRPSGTQGFQDASANDCRQPNAVKKAIDGCSVVSASDRASGRVREIFRRITQTGENVKGQDAGGLEDGKPEDIGNIVVSKIETKVQDAEEGVEDAGQTAYDLCKDIEKDRIHTREYGEVIGNAPIDQPVQQTEHTAPRLTAAPLQNHREARGYSSSVHTIKTGKDDFRAAREQQRRIMQSEAARQQEMLTQKGIQTQAQPQPLDYGVGYQDRGALAGDNLALNRGKGSVQGKSRISSRIHVETQGSFDANAAGAKAASAGQGAGAAPSEAGADAVNAAPSGAAASSSSASTAASGSVSTAASTGASAAASKGALTATSTGASTAASTGAATAAGGAATGGATVAAAAATETGKAVAKAANQGFSETARAKALKAKGKDAGGLSMKVTDMGNINSIVSNAFDLKSGKASVFLPVAAVLVLILFVFMSIIMIFSGAVTWIGDGAETVWNWIANFLGFGEKEDINIREAILGDKGLVRLREGFAKKIYDQNTDGSPHIRRYIAPDGITVNAAKEQIRNSLPSDEAVATHIQGVLNGVLLMDHGLQLGQSGFIKLLEEMYEKAFYLETVQTTEWCGQDTETGEGTYATHSCGAVHANDDCPNTDEGLHSGYECADCCLDDGTCSGYVYCGGHNVTSTYIGFLGVSSLLYEYFLGPLSSLAPGTKEFKRLSDYLEVTQIMIQLAFEEHGDEIGAWGGGSTLDFEHIGDRQGCMAVASFAYSQLQPIKYTDKNKFNGYNGQPWCGYFTMYVYNNMGGCSCHSPGEYAAARSIPNPSTSAIVQNAKSLGRWKNAPFYQPAPGDLVLFRYPQNAARGNPPVNHVGIVVRVDGGMVWIVDGNWGDDVAYRSLPLSDYRIVGYALMYDYEAA